MPGSKDLHVTCSVGSQQTAAGSAFARYARAFEMARKLDSASICEYHHGYCKGTGTASKPHPSTAQDSAEMSPGLLSFSLTTLVILPNTSPAFQTVGPFSLLPSLSLSFSSFHIHLLSIPCMPGSRDTSTNIMHSLKLLIELFI